MNHFKEEEEREREKRREEVGSYTKTSSLLRGGSCMRRHHQLMIYSVAMTMHVRRVSSWSRTTVNEESSDRIWLSSALGSNEWQMVNSDVATRHEAANWIRVINKIKPSACSKSNILTKNVRDIVISHA